MPTVLLVDDDPGIRSLLPKFIKRVARNIKIAVSLEEAFECMRNPPVPDFVFLDLKLPPHDRDHVIASIPQFKVLNPDVIILVITGTTPSEKLEEASKATGADGFRYKIDLIGQVEILRAMDQCVRDAKIRTGRPYWEIADNILTKVATELATLELTQNAAPL